MTPLYVDRVAKALENTKAAFKGSDSARKKDLQFLDRALDKLDTLPSAALETVIAAFAEKNEEDRVGARPTAEQDSMPLIVQWKERWADHREAREWAADVLADVITCAVDGSQIFPSRDMSVPVGLVQVGWFINPHRADERYIKDVDVQVLTPDELAKSFEAGTADQEVSWRRFAGEVGRLQAFMEAYRGQKALAFLDGSLILSFVGSMWEERQNQYINLIEGLLACSEETRVPVVGFIDSSHATDLTTLLQVIGSPVSGRTGDAALLQRRMEWGDRLRLFVCDRRDEVIRPDYYRNVLFTYLKTTRDRPPARIEMPAWVFQAGQHDWVLDAVRAECIIGLGYPYALETADAVAVLTMQDRERFYRLFQQFATDLGIHVRFSRKAQSKRARRV
ncbi:MAG: DNA double-strand break repair nuclease NurA [Anaerolineae bacterium]